MKNNIKKCEECEFYNISQSDSEKGNCLFYGLVSRNKRKFQQLTLFKDSSCIYKLKLDQEIDLTERGIVEIVNRVPGTLLGHVDEKDIILKQIKEIERVARVFTKRD